MRNLKLFLMFFVALGFVSTSCDKDDDNNDTPPVVSYQGSASLTIDGVLHNVLQSDVAQIPEGVTFLMQSSSDESTFNVALTEVPAIGETVTLDLNAPAGTATLMLANGPIPNVIALIGGSGTVKRTSEKNYEVDAILYGGMNFTDEYVITGTFTVGVISL